MGFKVIEMKQQIVLTGNVLRCIKNEININAFIKT